MPRGPNDGLARKNYDRPEILAGKPVIKGTRLSVDFILALLAEGWTKEQLLANYPPLQTEDVRASLAYAAEVVRDETTYPIPA